MLGEAQNKTSKRVTHGSVDIASGQEVFDILRAVGVELCDDMLRKFAITCTGRRWGWACSSASVGQLALDAGQSGKRSFVLFKWEKEVS
jgi:hypothetical protein